MIRARGILVVAYISRNGQLGNWTNQLPVRLATPKYPGALRLRSTLKLLEAGGNPAKVLLRVIGGVPVCTIDVDAIRMNGTSLSS